MHQLAPGAIKAIQAGTAESNAENIRAALARSLPELQLALCAHDGNMVIVGSGPSLPLYLEAIREEKRKGRPICAIKGAHDWLMENGVEPDLFVTCEPRSRPLKVVSAHCKYLLASRCAPDLFDQLGAAQVVVWHSMASRSDSQPPKDAKTVKWEDLDPEPECEAFRGRLAVGGGSTSGLRAINIAYMLGFRSIVLYGFDSCLAADRNTKRFTGENVGDGLVVDVICGGRRFWCNGAMAKQATEFQLIIGSLAGLKVESHGDGLITEILKQRALRASA